MYEQIYNLISMFFKSLKRNLMYEFLISKFNLFFYFKPAHPQLLSITRDTESKFVKAANFKLM